jgi:hypothetical protein
MRTYLSILVAAALFTVFITSFASWTLDPYGIRHAVEGRVTRPINDRVSKIGFLVKSCRDFNGYIVGNSRTQILSGSEFAAGGGTLFYNLGTPQDDIGESLERIELLFKIGCPISSLLVGESVDIFAHPSEDSLWESEHPLVSGENPFLFYSRYFLGPQRAIAYIRSKAKPTSRPMFYHSDGHIDFLWDMKSDADFAVGNCKRSRMSGEEIENLYARLSKYRRLAELAAEHRVKVVVWLTPLSKTKGVALDDPDVGRYIAELRQIPGLGVFEADRNSPLLSDFHQWHDCSHFHREVFDKLVAPGVAKLLQQ